MKDHRTVFLKPRARKRNMAYLHTARIFPSDEFEAFQMQIYSLGMSMSGFLRLLVHRVAQGDKELIDRVRG